MLWLTWENVYIIVCIIISIHYIIEHLKDTFYTLYFILYTLYFILYTLYFILYTLYFILYTLYPILYTLNHIFFIDYLVPPKYLYPWPFSIIYSLIFLSYSSYISTNNLPYLSVFKHLTFNILSLFISSCCLYELDKFSNSSYYKLVHNCMKYFLSSHAFICFCSLSGSFFDYFNSSLSYPYILQTNVFILLSLVIIFIWQVSPSYTLVTFPNVKKSFISNTGFYLDSLSCYINPVYCSII